MNLIYTPGDELTDADEIKKINKNETSRDVRGSRDVATVCKCLAAEGEAS